MNRRIVLSPLRVIACFSLFAAGCGPDAATPSPAALVSKKTDEQELVTITLTEKSSKYQREDILKGLAEVQVKKAPRQRTFSGEMIVPPGKTVRVTAPLAGVAMAPKDGVPSPGSEVKQGDAIFEFFPLLSPEAKANLETAALEAKQQIESAQIQLKAAQLALSRAEQLAKDQTASQRVVDEAIAARDLAEVAVETAKARSQFLKHIVAESAAGKTVSRSLTAPINGVLQRVEAAAGEAVPAGAPLFEVIQVEGLWVRVPLYVGWLSEINEKKNAEVRPLGADPKAKTSIFAEPRPIAPRQADPQAASADLYYKLIESQQPFRPGQKVDVKLTLNETAESLVIPWAAVVFDVHGGAWVYEHVKDNTFRRRRVEVRYVDGNDAVLSRGLEKGAKVVTGGAAELWGTEFGVGK